MVPRLDVLLASLTALMLAFPISADFVTLSFEDANDEIMALPGQIVPSGYTVWRVYAVFDNPKDALFIVEFNGSESIFSGLLFQDPFNGDGPPNPAAYDLSPTVASDSFVTVGTSESPSDVTFAPDFEFTPNGIGGTWFDGNPLTPATPGPDGGVLIAQLTLPIDAVGELCGSIWFEDADNPGTVSKAMIPHSLSGCGSTPPCAADFDNSGEVGAEDLAAMLAVWGLCGDGHIPCPESLNGDGGVDEWDLAILLSQWGPCL
jgi:hypothetical protein